MSLDFEEVDLDKTFDEVCFKVLWEAWREAQNKVYREVLYEVQRKVYWKLYEFRF